jgi:Protein of unknown function (DUF3800)
MCRVGIGGRRLPPGFTEFVRVSYWEAGDVVVTLSAYFDESGDPGDPGVIAFAMGGCIAGGEEWLTFDSKWSRILGEEGVSWFHMVDFEHPERKHGNEFFGWSDTRRHGLLNRLLDIINEHVTCIGTGQRLPSPRRSIEDYYYSHYRTCVTRPALFAHKEPVNFVFARHPTITGKEPRRKEFSDYHDLVVRAYSERPRWEGRLGSVVVDDARRIPALQAADIVAYELGRQQTQPAVERYPLRRLREKQTYFYDLNF